jgi:hypothetical protein
MITNDTSSSLIPSTNARPYSSSRPLVRAVGKPSLPHLEGDPEQLTYADGCGFGIIQKPSE